MDERIERIEEMEEKLNAALDAIDEMQAALDEYEDVLEDIEELEEYLASDEWKEDFLADENGELPDDLDRGVLSEDGIYDMLEENAELRKRLAELISRRPASRP